MNSIPVLVEAKKEYTNQLQQILSPRLYEGFKSIYNDILKAISDEIIENNNQHSSVVKVFQKSLKDIPLWNNEMIKNEYGRIEKISNCDYFENLIEAVFITNTKILTSVQINNNNSLSIKINVPQPQHFIHKCYIECAKEIYKNPYIFDMSKNLTPKEKHSNLRESLSIINHSIANAIRDLLPIRDILKQGLLNESSVEENRGIEDNEISFQEKQENETMTGEDNIENINNDNNEEDEDNDEDNEDNDEDNEDNENDDEDNDDEEDNEDNDDEEDNEESNNDLNYENNELNKNNTEIIFEGKDNNENNLVENNINTDINQTISQDNEPNLYQNSELKQINLGYNPIIKKIDNVQKIDKSESKPQIEDLIKPNNSNLININSNIRKINNKKFIKKKLLGGKFNNSFYQKKYDENLANYNYTSESYLDDEDNKDISKNNINLNYNSSDDEDNNPIELV